MAENDFLIENGVLKKYTGAGGDVVVPASVMRIDGAFFRCTSLTSVTIPASVKIIGGATFAFCGNLKTVVFLGEEIQIIPSAFLGGFSAFYGCSSLREIILPPKTTITDKKCFTDCPLALGVFSYLPSPKEKLTGALLWLSGDREEGDDHSAIKEYIKKRKKILLSEIIKGNNTKAFAELVSVLGNTNIPLELIDESLKSAEGKAELTAALLDYKHKTYSDQAVEKAEDLKVKKALGEAKMSLADIKKEWQLDGQSIIGYIGKETEIVTPLYEGKTPIDTIDAFGLSPNRPRRKDTSHYSRITRITVGTDVKSIDDRAFSGCDALECVEILGDGVKLGTGLFANCSKLSEITIPKTAIYKGNVFLDCPLYKGKNGDLYVVNKTLISCVSSKKKTVTIPKNVTAIYTMAFDGCDKLTDVYIPKAVTDFIENGNANVQQIIHTPSGSPADAYYRSHWGKSREVINDVNENGEIIKAENGFVIENGILRKYSGAGGDVVIPDGVTSIEKEAFKSCMGLTCVTLPNTVVTIGEGAFRFCSNLTCVTLPDSVTSIGDNAFSGCKRLAINLPKSLTFIGESAFHECAGLTSVTLPDSVTSIGKNAFSHCYNLTSITVPRSVTTIGKGTFDFCRSLTSIVIPQENPKYHIDKNCLIETESNTLLAGFGTSLIPEGVTRIEDGAFSGRNELTELILPDSVVSIGAKAFNFCENLTTITISSAVKRIGKLAFSHCSSLENINFAGTIAEWQAIEKGDLWASDIPAKTIHCLNEP